MVCVCVCVPTTKCGNIVLEQGMREIFGLMTEGIAMGWTELYRVELHDLYWWVNCGGWWTEWEWGRWDKSNALGKLKMKTKFQLETLKVTGILGDLGLDEMCKKWDRLDIKIYNSSCLPLSTIQILPSPNISSGNWTNMSLRKNYLMFCKIILNCVTPIGHYFCPTVLWDL